MEILFTKKELNKKIIGVAVSGGKDSMALLHFLHKNKSDYGIKVVVINVDHCMRKGESLRDSNFVKDYCAKIGVPFYGYSADSDGVTLTTEEDARLYRYSCFYNAILDGKCDLVATAHHKSDLAETILLNVLRGTGISGLKGIPKCNDKNIIRPLLYTDKDEIDRYVNDENVPFVTDSTNLTTDYNRNFLRLEIIPKLTERFEALNDNLLKLSLLATIDDEYLFSVAKRYVKEKNGVATLTPPKNKAVFARAIIYALNLVGIKKDYEKKHVDALFNLHYNGKTGAQISLINGVTAIYEYGKIVFFVKSSEKNYERPFAEGVFETESAILTVKSVDRKKVNLKEKNFHYIDKDKLPPSATIRTRRDGDYFKAFSGSGKKLKEYLIDKKVPKRLRDDVLLICDGQSVLYVGGMEISFDLRLDNDSQNVLQLTYITKEREQ